MIRPNDILVWLADAAGSPTAIPYRTDAAVSGGSVLTALLASAVLLVLLVAVLLQARRRGWLPGTPRALATPAKDIQIRSSRRISMVTTVHVIEFEGQAYLLTESARGSSASLTPLARETMPATSMDEGS
ncbi:hypothetical protein [Dyella sp.]|uniref:hypothetical protein n=1 Tax=Dyella sp. TaxID=1869338 RepID=UPI002ED470C3